MAELKEKYLFPSEYADYNPDIPDLPVNSPRAHYALSDIALKTIKTFKTNKWKVTAKLFTEDTGGLKKKYNKPREMFRVPL